jgi:hypothetical protein
MSSKWSLNNVLKIKLHYFTQLGELRYIIITIIIIIIITTTCQFRFEITS